MKIIYLIPVVMLIALTPVQSQQLYKYDFTINHLAGDINTDEHDYSPVFDVESNTLYFNSYRDDNSRGEADVFRVKIENGMWGKVENAGKSFNTSDDDGSLSMAKDGYTVVFASKGRDGGFGDVDLYSARIDDERKLNNITNLGDKVNSSSWESQPSVTGDGLTMYFASDRPGGFGGTDIWVTTNDGWGKWSKPINLGPSINTDGDEAAPNITPEGGTLYFSSNGISGYGKQDIYVSRKFEDIWEQPVNLGPIINTPEDELYFYAPDKGEFFFFASSRDGGEGELDIYSGTPNVFGKGMFTLMVNVIDSLNQTPLPSSVTIENLETGEIVESFTTNAMFQEETHTLPAMINYKVIARFRDYPPKSAIVESPPANEEQHVILKYGDIEIADFDLGEYNIPFFVTGYYRPNVIENMERMQELLKGELRKASYIERIFDNPELTNKYHVYAETVQRLFEEVFIKLDSDILPIIGKQDIEGEKLVIEVTGYADPQPILGKYLENDTITFVDSDDDEHVVLKGDKMTNLKLSGLRAYHSAQHLTRLFKERGSYLYAGLLQQGKIEYKYIGAGVSDNQEDYAAQRRIRIRILRKGEKFDF
jgi:WD40 repeat protein